MFCIYFRLKIKKYALKLLVLQGVILFFCLICIPIYISSIKNEIYSSNRQSKSASIELIKDTSFKLATERSNDMGRFKERVMKEKRGVEYWETAANIEEIATAYQMDLVHFSETIEAIWKKDNLDASKSDKRQVILQQASRENWREKILQVLEDFHCDVKSELFWLFEREDDVTAASVEYEQFYKKQMVKNREVFHAVTFNELEDIQLLLAMLHNRLIIDSHVAIQYCIARTGTVGMFLERQYIVFNPESKTIKEGEDFVATIFLARRASSHVKEILVNDDTLQVSFDGVFEYRTKAKDVGTYEVEVSIPTKDPFMKPRVYYNKYEYTVLPKCN